MTVTLVDPPSWVADSPLTSAASRSPPDRANPGVAIRGSVGLSGASYPIQAITDVVSSGSPLRIWSYRLVAFSLSSQPSLTLLPVPGTTTAVFCALSGLPIATAAFPCP